MAGDYSDKEPRREELDVAAGPLVVEFGSPWCGYCRRAKPVIEQAFAGHAGVRHVKVHDASGRRLGRSFGIKLWPTLIFLKDGKELERLVRPGDAGAIAAALARIAS